MWMKITSALFLGMMVIMLWPQAKRALKENPKGTADDWKGVLIPLLLVAGFVILLIKAV